MNEERLPPIFYDLHSGLPREGPGNRASTMRALGMIPDLPRKSRILDIGCGPGMQTLDLARATAGSVTALDNHPPYLRELERRAASEGLSDRIVTRLGDMHAPLFEPKSFDLIWSEGAIYIMGFEQGLSTWRPLLVPGGYLAVSEAVWLKPDPPASVREFWREYPGMMTVPAACRVIRDSGCELIGHFTLPESAWWDDYYTPLAARIDQLAAEVGDDPVGLEVLEDHRREIAVFRDFSEYYGYEFFVCRRPDR